MCTRHYFAILTGLFLLSVPASGDDGRGRDDRPNDAGRRHLRHGGGFRPGPVLPSTLGYGVAYVPSFGWGGPAYYDPFFIEANQAAFEFQRQQARQEAERALQAEADAQAAAAERLAGLKDDARRRRAAAAAKLAAKNFASGNYRGAAANYIDAAALAADDASAYFMLAQSQFAMKQFFDAAKSLRTAVRLNPNLVDFNVLGFYKNAEEFRQQLTALADELRINPLNRDAMFLLGHMLFVSGRKAEAKTILLECAKLGVDTDVLKPYLDSYVPRPLSRIPAVPR